MAYLTAACPQCGIKINFQESSVGTLRRCEACGYEARLAVVTPTEQPSSFGCCAGVAFVVVLLGAAVFACGGLFFVLGSSVDVQQTAPPTPAVASEPEPVAEEKPIAEVRKWSDKTGVYSCEATFGGVAGTTVTLHRVDGVTLKLPLDRLSDSDREWIEERRKSH
jgi:SLA1 homology domain 1, SHD1